MKLHHIALSLALTVGVSTPAFSDVNGDLNGYFSSLGYSGNVS